MKKKLIFIVSEYFGPFQNVGSVKFTKIVKYLCSNISYEIMVFTRSSTGIIDPFLEEDIRLIEKNGVKIFSIYSGDEYIEENNKKKKKVVNILERKIKKIFQKNDYDKQYYIKNQIEAKLFSENAYLEFKKEINRKPDVIISTYDDWGGHYFAQKIKDNYPSAFWIADFRDPIGAAVKSIKYRKLCDDYSMDISRSSNVVTVASTDLINIMKFDNNSIIKVITNGFDYSDYDGLDAEKSNNKKLRIVFAGAYYYGNLNPLFKVIKELVNQNQIELNSIEFHYAGQYGNKIKKEISQNGLEEIYKDYGLINRKEANRLQNSADILIVLSVNRDDWQGVITGKFLASLCLRKRIIALVDGNKSDSEIKRRIKQLRCGYCYEEINRESDYSLLKNEIYKAYLEKVKNGKVFQEYNDSELSKYYLKNIAKQYEDLFPV